MMIKTFLKKNYYIFENDELGSFVFDGHYYFALTVKPNVTLDKRY